MIPVTIITGFLGSGKTTLLNHLLNDPGMADTAVVINEFGEIALDHLLVESSLENTLVLQSGCICCTVRGDLVDTLVELVAKRDRGDIPSFSRVAIETTGLADPAPILHTLATDPLIAERFKLKTVVTTLDAVNGASQLQRFSEAMKQIALADIVALTKSDLAGENEREVLKAEVKRINPAAVILEVQNGVITPDDLFGHSPADPRANPDEIRKWLDAEAFADHDHHHGHDHHHDHGHHEHSHNDPNRHGDDIRAFCLTIDEPIQWSALEMWLNSILSLRGKDMLRMKGILNVADQPGPIIVHGVQHLLHPLVRLTKWPDADRTSKIVFITQNIPQAALQNSLDVLRRG